MARRASLIFNPASGRGKPKQSLLPELLEELRDAGLEVEPAPTQSPGHATALAREAAERGVDLVLAWGGDGTLNEVVAGMLGSTTPLALLPGGSVNVFAKGDRYPTSFEEGLPNASRCRAAEHTGWPGERTSFLAHGRDSAWMLRSCVSSGLGVKQKLGVLGFWLKGFAHAGFLPIFFHDGSHRCGRASCHQRYCG